MEYICVLCCKIWLDTGVCNRLFFETHYSMASCTVPT
jgi:hypothetical protein